MFAVMVSVRVDPFVMFPMFHIPVVELYVPVDGMLVVYVSPFGSWSVICTPVALSGPLLVVVMV